MPHKVRHVALLVLLAYLLAACSPLELSAPEQLSPTPAPTDIPATPTIQPVVLNKTLRMEQGGFTLRYPSDWHTRELTGTLALSPSEAALDAQTSSDSLVMLLDSTPLAAIAAEHGEEVIADSASFFEFVSQAPREFGYTLSETTPITVDNTVGRAATLQIDGGEGRLVAFVTDVQGVRILGQASSEGWNQHRAAFEAIVASLNFFTPPQPPTPTSDNPIEQPVITTEGPPGFVLRIGGDSGPNNGRFVSARGLAVAPDGTVYLAESSQGIWVFQPDGTLVTTFGNDELLDAYDVAVAPNGDLYVADYGRNAIARFDAQGNLIQRWGETGDGPDQFGLSSPQRIAIGADGSIYALDSRMSPDGNSAVGSIMRFNGENGSFIGRIDLPAGSAPNDFAVDAQGFIYLADAFGSGVVKVDEVGQEVARLGDAVSGEEITAGAIEVDAEGNLYVATWDAGVLKLTPDGVLLARAGAAVDDAEKTPEPGQFQLPNGIAVDAVGQVWVSDNSGEYSAITALQLTSDADPEATAEGQSTAEATPIPEEQLERVWATSATASSAYTGYDANNVIGPPDVEGCLSSQNAWASADPNGLETLEVEFDQPLFATQVNIYQNHQPGFITTVELIDEQGKTSSVYNTAPQLQSECPAVLRVQFARTPARIVGVRLTIDQRSGANWNEIDAVELVGLK